ncbi:MAG TPA: hypothetical protein VH063_15180 [Gaiellaceae bacterium]|nr:hypothetical protein [Gaiellaceae bacterium]
MASPAAAAPYHHLASGRFHGHAWSVSASDTVSNGEVSYCLDVSLWDRTAKTNRAETSCSNAGPLTVPARASSFPHGFGYLGRNDCPTIYLWAGPVVSTARTVELTLSTGATLRVKTIPPPLGLSKRVAFWVARVPCSARVTALSGRNGAGETVALVPIRFS